MNTVTIPSVDTTTFCRVCFSDINLLIAIRPEAADAQSSHQQLLQLVKTYLQLEFGGANDFPSAVCELCYRVLQDFDALYKNAQQHNEALKVLMDSDMYHQSEPAKKTTEEVQDAEETTLVEILEPSAVVHDEKNMSHGDTAPGDESFDGQIIFEEVPFTDTANEEHQVHVFHLDGELQQVIIAEENNGARRSLNGGTKPLPTFQPKVVKKSVQPLLNGRPLLKPTQGPRAPQKPLTNYTLLKTLNTHASQHDAPHLLRQKLARAAAPLLGRREKVCPVTIAKKHFRCNRCTALFVDQSKYYSHDCLKQQPSTSHAGGRFTYFQCNECNVNFRRELYWQKHLYEVHGICSENFGITCSICQIQFSQRQDYQLHVLAMH